MPNLLSRLRGLRPALTRRAFWLWAALITLLRCAVTHFQLAYMWAGGAPLDDELMFRAANAITSRQDKNRLPTHIGVRANRCGLAKDSIVLTEQIRTLDKRRLRERAGRIPEDDMRRVDEALGVSMGLHDQPVAQSTHMDGGYF